MSEYMSRKKLNRHWLMLIPMGMSGLWFFVLEIVPPIPKYILHVRLDDYIPFLPIFIIPYVIWYFYIGAPVVYFLLKSPQEFTRLAAFLASGMMVACTFYTFLSNGQNLRPALSSCV